MQKILPVAGLLVAIIGVLGGGLLVHEIRQLLGLRDLSNGASAPSAVPDLPRKQELPVGDPAGTEPGIPAKHGLDRRIDPTFLARMRAEYDLASSRIAAVRKSLEQRAQDLGNTPLKPEITSALNDCRMDLAAAKVAIDNGEGSVARSRLDHMKELLNYLESL